MEQSSVLVTGGAGFIGSHLAERLQESYETVHVSDNFTTGTRRNVPDGAVMHETDLTSHTEVVELFDDIQPSVVYHLAAASNVNGSDSSTGQFRHNTDITRNIIDVGSGTTVPDIVFASSSVVYGETADLPTKETHELDSTSYYGAGKIGSESLLRTYESQTDATVCCCRLANVVGPRLRNAVVPDFIEKLHDDSSTLVILGNGKQSKSYIHVNDCIEAMRHVYQESDGITTVNIGTHSTLTVDEIADIVSDVMDIDPAYSYTGGEKGWEGDIPRMQLDISRLVSLGFSPEYTSEQAVKKASRQLVTQMN